MSEKTDNEVVELLWGITEKLDKLLTAIEKVCASVPPKAGDVASQMTIDTGEPK